MNEIKYPEYDTPGNPDLAAALNEIVGLIRNQRPRAIVGGRGISVSSNAETAVVSLDQSADGAEYRGRFQCFFDPHAQRLWITCGWVADLSLDEQRGPLLTYPYEAYIDEEPMSKFPFWDVSTLTTGIRYDVMVLVGYAMPEPRVALIAHDTIIDDGDVRAAFCVADFELGSADEGKRKMVRFRQRWRSDVTITSPTTRFTPILHPNGSGGYYVMVTEGNVSQRDLTRGLDQNALGYWACENRLDGSSPRKFPIGNNQAIYVRVYEDNTGKIAPLPAEGEGDPTPAVSLVVAADDVKSLNYYPISTTDAQHGVYYYKLASLKITAGVPELSHYLSGGNINHTSGLSADVVFEDCSGDPTPPSGPPIPNVQIARLRFISGGLAGLNEDQATVPLSHINSVKNITPCCVAE